MVSVTVPPTLPRRQQCKYAPNVGNALRLVTAVAIKGATLGATVFTEATTCNAWALAGRTECRRTLVYHADKSEDEETTVAIPSKSSPDSVALQATFS
eukprot:710911-Amphidinium_carterae.1